TPDLERLWLLCALAESLGEFAVRDDLRAQCAMYMRSRPKAALLALAVTRLAPETCLVHLIQTGLGGIQPREHVDPVETRGLWARPRPRPGAGCCPGRPGRRCSGWSCLCTAPKRRTS